MASSGNVATIAKKTSANNKKSKEVTALARKSHLYSFTRRKPIKRVQTQTRAYNGNKNEIAGLHSMGKSFVYVCVRCFPRDFSFFLSVWQLIGLIVELARHFAATQCILALCVCHRMWFGKVGPHTTGTHFCRVFGQQWHSIKTQQLKIITILAQAASIAAAVKMRPDRLTRATEMADNNHVQCTRTQKNRARKTTHKGRKNERKKNKPVA